MAGSIIFTHGKPRCDGGSLLSRRGEHFAQADINQVAEEDSSHNHYHTYPEPKADDEGSFIPDMSPENQGQECQHQTEPKYHEDHKTKICTRGIGGPEYPYLAMRADYSFEKV